MELNKTSLIKLYSLRYKLFGNKNVFISLIHSGNIFRLKAYRKLNLVILL